VHRARCAKGVRISKLEDMSFREGSESRSRERERAGSLWGFERNGTKRGRTKRD